MNPKTMKFSTVVATMSLVIAVGCSSAKKDQKKEKPKAQPAPTTTMTDASTGLDVGAGAPGTENAPAPQTAAAGETAVFTDQVDFAALEFDKGEAKLSEMDRRHLNELAMKMTGAGKVVDDIKILTWSDRAVATDQDASNTEIILARQRAESIKNYLERNLPAEEDIDFYNMAENPKRYSTYMKRKGVPVEQAFNEDGKAGSPDGKALVIIEYQSGPMPSTL